jgi:tRNA (guanine-N7-)-methyltransferase
MRLKNIPGAREYVSNSDYVILEPENYRGKWKKVFNNSNDIHIEIGMGRGNFIINMALKYPNTNFIGIEIYDSVIIKAIKKLESLENKVTNLKIVRMDATYIEDVFDHQISRIYLNYSDPWPKAKHSKRRLTSPQFLARYENVFAGEKQIFQKTDNDALFEFSLESLKDAGYSLKNVTYDLYSDEKNLEDNVPTEYESKFVSKGIKIKRLEAYKS